MKSGLGMNKDSIKKAGILLYSGLEFIIICFISSMRSIRLISYPSQGVFLHYIIFKRKEGVFSPEEMTGIIFEGKHLRLISDVDTHFPYKSFLGRFAFEKQSIPSSIWDFPLL